jgi:hypothetical protein
MSSALSVLDKSNHILYVDICPTLKIPLTFRALQYCEQRHNDNNRWDLHAPGFLCLRHPLIQEQLYNTHNSDWKFAHGRPLFQCAVSFAPNHSPCIEPYFLRWQCKQAPSLFVESWSLICGWNFTLTQSYRVSAFYFGAYQKLQGINTSGAQCRNSV